MTDFINFVLTRLKEKSTITTILTLVAGAAGLHFAPAQQDLIAGAVVAVVSCIASFWGQDHKPGV